MLGAEPAPSWSLGAVLCVGDAERRLVSVHPLLWKERCLGGRFLSNSFCFWGSGKPCKFLLQGRGKEHFFFFLSVIVIIIIAGYILCLTPVVIP